MGKDFVEFRWTSWDDEVGGKISKEINYAVDKANRVYEQFDRAVYDVEGVLSSQITYQSQGFAIQSLEIK